MNTLSLPILQGTNLLTHSRMSSYKTCARKHYFSYEVGLRREHTSQPLRMGAAYAMGREVLGKTRDLAAAVQAVRDNYAVIPEWALMEEGGETDWLTECEKVTRMLAGHAWRWGNDGLEVVAAEQRFELPLVNPDTGAASRTFMLAGKIDAIVKLPDGRLAIREDKTTSDDIAPGSDYWRRLRIDQQISLYMYAARKLGYDVQTILYDVAAKPGIAPKKLSQGDTAAFIDSGSYFNETFTVGMDGTAYTVNGQPVEVDASGKKPVIRETPAMYGARFNADIAERPDHYYARMEITRLESDLKEFEAELWQIGKQILDARNGGRWFRSTNACLSPYKCEFWDLCSNGINTVNREEAAPTGFAFLQNTLHPELEQ